MDQHTETPEQSRGHHGGPTVGREVHVTVDNEKVKVRSGDWIISDFKAEVGVDAAKELDQIVDGVLKPLDDAAHIAIVGKEVFISHPRTGGSS